MNSDAFAERVTRSDAAEMDTTARRQPVGTVGGDDGGSGRRRRRRSTRNVDDSGRLDSAR